MKILKKIKTDSDSKLTIGVCATTVTTEMIEIESDDNLVITLSFPPEGGKDYPISLDAFLKKDQAVKLAIEILKMTNKMETAVDKHISVFKDNLK